MAPLRLIASRFCRYVARGPKASSVLTRAIEAAPPSNLPMFRPRAAVFPSRAIMDQEKKICIFTFHQGKKISVPSTSFSLPLVQSSPQISSSRKIWTAAFQKFFESKGKCFTTGLSGKLLVQTASGRKMLSAVLQNFVQSEIAMSGTELARALCQKFWTDVLQKAWANVVETFWKLLVASLWAASGVLFYAVDYGSDGTIRLKLRSGDSIEDEEANTASAKFMEIVQEFRKISTQEAEKTSDKLVEVIQEEFSKMSSQTAENYESLVKKQDEEWKQLRDELRSFKITTQASMMMLMFPKMVDIAQVMALKPDLYRLPIGRDNESK